jgi:hypothetical protein
MYGKFESNPTVFNDDEAWVLYDEWRELNAFEVSYSAALMSKEKFEKTWRSLPLPPLPAHAFADAEKMPFRASSAAGRF